MEEQQRRERAKTCAVAPRSCVRPEPEAEPPACLPGSAAVRGLSPRRGQWLLHGLEELRGLTDNSFAVCLFTLYFIPPLRRSLGRLQRGGGGACSQRTLCWGRGSCFPGCQRSAISRRQNAARTTKTRPAPPRPKASVRRTVETGRSRRPPRPSARAAAAPGAMAEEE